MIRDDADIDFDWDDDGPLVGFPADNFSARWERTLEFPEGVTHSSSAPMTGFGSGLTENC